MKTFTQYLADATTTTSTITFGRFNPPTKGHGKLIEALKQHARFGEYTIFLSHSHDKKKNPLERSERASWLTEMFGDVSHHIYEGNDVETFLEAARHECERGMKNLRVVVGDDRVEEFQTKLDRYNGVEYDFDTIEVISAGVRNPDGEGVEAISATKMREYALNDDFGSFAKGIPGTLSRERKEALFHRIQEELKND